MQELKCMEHSPSALPNSLAQESDPHLLVCASSASGVEEIITRLKNYNLVNENRKTGSSGKISFCFFNVQIPSRYVQYTCDRVF